MFRTLLAGSRPCNTDKASPNYQASVLTGYLPKAHALQPSHKQGKGSGIPSATSFSGLSLDLVDFRYLTCSIMNQLEATNASDTTQFHWQDPKS